jgi:hypothetical protein
LGEPVEPCIGASDAKMKRGSACRRRRGYLRCGNLRFPPRFPKDAAALRRRARAAPLAAKRRVALARKGA